MKVERAIQFTMTYNHVIKDERLTKNDIVVYLIVAMHANKDRANSYPSIRTIAKESRSSTSTVQKSINHMVSLGYIEKTKKKQKKSAGPSNVYVLHDTIPVASRATKKSEGVAPRTTGCGAGDHKGVAPSDTGGVAPRTTELYPSSNQIPRTRSPNNYEASPPVADGQLFDNGTKGKKGKVVDEDKELYHMILESFESGFGTFDNYGKEGKAIKDIIRKAKLRPEIGDPPTVAREMMEEYLRLIKDSQDRFWGQQPFLPSVLGAAGIWPRVLDSVRRRKEQEALGSMIDIPKGYFDEVLST